MDNTTWLSTTAKFNQVTKKSFQCYTKSLKNIRQTQKCNFFWKFEVPLKNTTNSAFENNPLTQ